MFKALNQRCKFALLVLLSLLMPSPQPLIAQDVGEDYSIVPSPNQSLILDVEFDDRQYVVGEPIWIRCSMINVTPDPVKIFYGLGTEHNLLLDVRDPEGEVVPRIVHEVFDYGGPEIVTIDPGHRLVRVFSLLDEYYVKEPGEYQVTVRYESSGESVQRDATNSLVTKKATPCSLRKKLGGVRIVNPKQKIDQDAAGFLIGKGGQVDGLTGQVNSFSTMMWNQSKREGLIRDYGKSRLADYARYHEAAASLQRFKQTTGADFAKKALTELETIDTSGYPKLFQEYVHFRLIEAHQGAPSAAKQIDLQIEKFRELFPDSPLLSLFVGTVAGQITDAIETEVPVKPTNGLGKKTQLRRDEVVVGMRQYYDNDALFEEELYSNTKEKSNFVLHGKSRKWHRNGKPWQEWTYEKGVLNGSCTSWDSAGKLLATCDMKNGTGVLRTYHSAGRLKFECPYLKGEKHGNKRKWDKEGNLFEDTAFEFGKPHGPSRTYYPSGQREGDAMFRNGQLHGVSRDWNGGGEEAGPDYYVNGEKVTREAYQAATASDPFLPQIDGK